MNSNNLLWKALIIAGGILFVVLLIITFFYPLLHKKPLEISVQVHKPSTATIDDFLLPSYKRIAVALDFTNKDFQLIAHAIRQGNEQTRIIVIHIVESASAKILGKEADDLETRKDQEKLDDYVHFLQQRGFMAESKLGFRNRNEEIPKLVKEAAAELLVIGSHGHSGMKDWIYGETIDAVRHRLKIPVLIVSL